MSLVNRVGILYISLGRSVGYAHFFWREFMEASGFLHTMSSKSGAGLGVATFMAESAQLDLVNRSIAFLRGQEQQLYNWVGASSYPQFMKILRELFREAAQDAKILEKFKKANLNSIITAPIGTSVANGQTVTVHCIAPKKVNLAALIAKGIAVHNADVNITVQPGQEIVLTFDYNGPNIKNALNILDQRKGFTRFKEESSSMVNVNRKLKEMVDDNTIGSIVINGPNKDIDVTQEFGTDRSNPFGYTKEAFEKAIKDPVLLKELEQARDIVYNSLLAMCSGGSKEMYTAFHNVWNNKIGGNIKNFMFFSKGKNLKSGIGGAMQEFATAMLFEYIGLKKKTNHINGRISEILGNIAGGSGEQPKTDVEILGAIGIQVKAYNQESLVDMHGNARMMTTNIHPQGLDAGLLGYGLNIGDAMVQCCFNTSNGYDAAYFSKIIEQYALAQAMNFTTNEMNTDTVCFYFLDAQYLVPGSVILSRLKMVKPKVSIRQPGPIGNDDTFEIKDYTTTYIDKNTGKSREHTVKRFVEYWNGYPLDASDENLSYYDALYTKRISIDVKFEYQFMYGSNFAVY